MDRSGPDQQWRRAALAIVVVGVALRLFQWLSNPSFWMDEHSLVQNFRERGLLGLLLVQLGYGQVAPAGYLLITKLSAMAFGDGEIAYRLVPALASVLALLLVWRLAPRLLGSIGGFTVTAGFALNPMLISLSGVAKQYATDVLATVLVLSALWRLWDLGRPLRSRVVLAVGAGAIGLLSIPSVIVAAGALAGLFWRTMAFSRRESTLGWYLTRLTPIFVWGFVAGSAALWARALVGPGLSAYMVNYWELNGAFAPPFLEQPTWVLGHWANVMLPGFLLKPYIGSAGELGSHLGSLIRPEVLLAALALSGAALVRCRGIGWTVAVMLPFVIALGLAGLRLYPMNPRTSVFLLPLVLLLMGALVVVITDALSRIPRARVAVPVLCVPIIAALIVDRPPPYVVQRDREVIRELTQRRQRAEPVFAHAWAGRAIGYYGERFGLGEGVIIGVRDIRRDLATIGALRGEPSVWVLFTHSWDRTAYICYLDEVGVEVETVLIPGGIANNPASLHRYDLSDEARWVAANPPSLPDDPASYRGTSPRCEPDEVVENS